MNFADFQLSNKYSEIDFKKGEVVPYKHFGNTSYLLCTAVLSSLDFVSFY